MFYELGRNPHYWQPGKPVVNSMRVAMYHSNQAILQALEKGELDWASLFVPNIEKTYVATDPARHTYWYPDFGNTALLYLNTQKKPFDDKNVRKAISMAIDRQRIMTEAVSGYAPPADATGLAESQKRWKDAAAQAAPWTRRNVAEANRLLDAAGLARGADGIRTVPGGGPMRYDIHCVAGWSDWEAAIAIIQQSLAEVGVAAAPAPLPYQAWVDKLQKGRFDMGIWSSTRGPTPYQFYRGQMDAALVRPIGEEATDNFHRFAQRHGEPHPAAVRGLVRPGRAAGPGRGAAEDLRRERSQPAPLREPALGRVQHLALRGLPGAGPSLRGRGSGPDRRAARARGDRSALGLIWACRRAPPASSWPWPSRDRDRHLGRSVELVLRGVAQQMALPCRCGRGGRI